jgi:hypothetical protein
VETESGGVDYGLPESIDGQPVAGIESDYAVRGDLVPHDDEAEIELGVGEAAEARVWLQGRGWQKHPAFEQAWERIRAALTPIAGEPRGSSAPVIRARARRGLQRPTTDHVWVRYPFFSGGMPGGTHPLLVCFCIKYQVVITVLR